ncbi:MAG: HAD hydrolase family protein [Caulobacter sp.]|nr:HAD hydrolase family protein [Caulobacter sp.]
MVAEFRQLEPGISFATEHGHKLGLEPRFPDFFADTVHHHAPRVDRAEALLIEALTKLLVHHPDHAVEVLLSRLRGYARDRFEVIWSGAPFVEIAPMGVSKGAGLAAYCGDLGLTAAEVIAFGDMPNDLPMLTFAGCGVAVANAHPDLLAAADQITSSNEADGVAEVIETLLS